MSHLRMLALCTALIAASGSSASAAFFTFNISGLASDGFFPDQFPTLTHDFGGAGTVVNVAFDVNFTAIDPSWQSEVQIAIDTDDDFSFDGDIDMFEFGAPDIPGLFSIAGSITANSFSSNGLVYLTLYEFFDDDSIAPDAIFGANSTVTVEFTPSATAVPEPSSLALCGIAGLVGYTTVRVRRSRRAA